MEPGKDRRLLSGKITVSVAASSLVALWLLAAVNSPAFAPESIVLLPHWKAGEKIQFEMVRTRERTTPGTDTSRGIARTDLEIEVLSADDDSSLLAWTWGKTRFDDPAAGESPLAQKLANILEGVPYIIELDSEASIQGVRNWEQLKADVAKVMDILTGEMKAAGTEQPFIDQVRAQVGSMFGSRQQIEQLCTKEAQLFFMVLGVEMEIGKPLKYEDSLPNPYGGEPFPSHAVLELEEVDSQAGLARIKWVQSVDEEDGRRIMAEILKALAVRTGKPVPEIALPKIVTIEETADFTIEMTSGWIRNLNHQRTTRTDGSTQVDKRMITRKPRGMASLP